MHEIRNRTDQGVNARDLYGSVPCLKNIAYNMTESAFLRGAVRTKRTAG